jgi:superfamily II DNA or RNA helicase
MSGASPPGPLAGGLEGDRDFALGQQQVPNNTEFRVPLDRVPNLHPFQRDVRARIEAEIGAGRRRIGLIAPTGAGKTIVASAMIADAVARREHVVFVGHRRELTEQTSAKLYAAGVDHGVLQAGFPTRPGAPVQVCSIQTLLARAMRTRLIDLPPSDLLFIDECHHARARTYERLIAAYPNSILIGMTATPCRSDGRGLGNVFEVLVEAPSVAKLTSLGFLVPAKIFAPVRPDLTGIRVQRGDYVETELAKRVDTAQLVGDIVEHWHRFGEGRRTVVFTVNVPHSVHIRNEFRRSGVLAEHIDGSTPIEERKSILDRFAVGTVDIVSNCAVLTEGWDRPEASCLILARPTKCLGVYRQMVGRVLRIAPHVDKKDALILDHSGSVFMHGFPDDEIHWTLHQDQRAVNVAHAIRGEYHAPALTTCRECHAVRFEGKPCPVCGWHPVPKPRPVVVVDGELARVNRTSRRIVADPPSFAEREQFRAQLAWIALERGYKPGWIFHKYKERFGILPPFGVIEPMSPDAATRAWVRSRMIAFARATGASR